LAKELVMCFDFYHETLTTVKFTTDFSPLRIRFESQGSTHGICGVQIVDKTGFFTVLQFPLRIYIAICYCSANSIDCITNDQNAASEPRMSRADCL